MFGVKATLSTKVFTIFGNKTLIDYLLVLGLCSFGPPELVNWPAVGLLKTPDDVNCYISLLPMTKQV